MLCLCRVGQDQLTDQPYLLLDNWQLGTESDQSILGSTLSVDSAIDSMAASISSSINLLECPMHLFAPANEEQRAPGLVAQLVTLRAPRGGEGLAQQEPAQDQGVGKVGWHAPCALACTW